MKRIATLMTLFVLLVFAVGLSAAELGFNGIGGRLSYVSPENIDGTIGLGVHADLGTLANNIVLFPSIEYWSKGEGGGDFSQIAINADAHYYFPTSGEIDFFAGGGLSILRSSFEVSFLGQSQSVSNTDIGLDLLGGLAYPLSENLMLNGEVKFTVSDGNIFKISAGVTYLLAK
jgi:opacity protein-like surface antigen